MDTINPIHGVYDDVALVEENNLSSTKDDIFSSDIEKTINEESHNHDHDHVIKPTKFPPWVYDWLEPIFKLKKRKVTIELELTCGLIQFISCLYVLPVVPFQMARVGYEEQSSIIATCATCAIGSIVAAFLTDVPFIVAPPTSVSIFLAVSMQQTGLRTREGNAAVMWSGLGLAIIGGIPILSKFFTKLIPNCIQASTAIGIGMITALAGATEIHLVVPGKYTIVDMGPITPEVVIAIASLVIVAAALHYHVKGAFCLGLMFGTFVWWIIGGEWPKKILENPEVDKSIGEYSGDRIILMTFNLLFLYILTLNGLARGFSDLAGITKKNGAVPRGNILFIVCGLTTILSGYLSGPPILISPESAAGIKAGAKTGLSTLICGMLFGIATFFSPIFAAVPAAGTAPLLMMVGVILFANTKRIDWTDYKESVPAFIVMFFIPFTYSILRGVAFGYVIYISIGLFTGDMIENSLNFIKEMKEQSKPKSKALSTVDGDVSSLEPVGELAGYFSTLVDMGASETSTAGIILH